MQRKMMMLTTTAYMSERFNRDNIMILEKMGYEVHVVANFDRGNPSTKEVLDDFQKWVDDHHGRCISIPITKHPSDQKNFWKSYHECMVLIEENKYEFIHCHTPVAGVLGRMLGHKSHTKVIYTAHGFHFFKGAPKKNWMIFYPIEKYFSKWTDMLITITKEDYAIAEEKFHAKKTAYIPGVGVDLNKFHIENFDREAKREELGWKPDEKVILSVGELNKNKNQETVIKALAQINDTTLRYEICGAGKNREQLSKLIEEQHLQNQAELLGYRNDISELCHAADLFILPSFREGLSLALMEAIAAKIPVVCSRIRGNVDLVADEHYLFDPHSVDDVAEKIKFALSKDNADVVEKNYKNILACDSSNVNRLMRENYDLIEKI